jgi:hypothetical protein
MDRYMKQILIEVDDRIARDLERLAPSRQRKRAEFIRLAIRRAIDLALDRTTEVAYRDQPLEDGVDASDRLGWDENNALARPAQRPRETGRRRGARSGA